jgi:hypothetical protein
MPNQTISASAVSICASTQACPALMFAPLEIKERQTVEQ